MNMSSDRSKNTDIIMEGRVIAGINNIYTVQVNNKLWTCRIKGKILKNDRKYYNPIAAGDEVQFITNGYQDHDGWIVSRKERKTSLLRWNKKRNAPQVIAANSDLHVCITSTESPPFRPRFLDRLILSGEIGKMENLIVVNKIDLGMTDFIKDRIDNFKSNGYKVLLCSAVDGRGIKKLKRYLSGRVAVFTGQSGVGKSSLLNKLDDRIEAVVGMISRKYNRGSHTTNSSRMYITDDKTNIIDTPGLRELEIYGIEPEELSFYFPDIRKYTHDCQYPSCRHLQEPGCAVIEAVNTGNIHRDRYLSYTSIYEQMDKNRREMYGRA